ncbi:SDR family oxidoreductase [Microbacterium trichothecenolyticum]|uniref:SDR family oxidoreductase n=1 Tax=Microbacterium ureisolvens TaxID=2781186 RepID=A0ABS7HYI9_9MICO|nr:MULTISPECIES: SDR family oxidoreductase [Microbacterium]MBW9110451.1 SDR family oxidoreductase [Microbacterium ureisolvens]MBW9120556.1 SDR family oxidoreductase [Microbacterium trichothecenolyticum]
MATVLTTDGRSVVILPAPFGLPTARVTIVLSHSHSVLTEISVDTDETDLGDIRGGSYQLVKDAYPAALPRYQSASCDRERVLVVASSSRLGSAIADCFAASGAAVARHGSKPRLGVLAQNLREDGAVDRLVYDAAEQLGGPVSVLIDCFGPWDSTPLSAANPRRFRASIDDHASLFLEFARATGPGMRERGRGRLIAISAGSAATLSDGVYGVGKHLRETLVRGLAAELGPEITVNAIAPGQIAESAEHMHSIDPTAVERALATTVSGRFVTHAEVAEVALALCRPAFDSLTGAIIPLDGGARLGSMA